MRSVLTLTGIVAASATINGIPLSDPRYNAFASVGAEVRATMKKSVPELKALSELKGDPSLYWTTDHHDDHNSNIALIDGPADGYEVCRGSLLPPDNNPFAPDAIDVFSTGVTGAGSNAYNIDASIFGGNDNILRISLPGLSTVTSYACDLKSWVPGYVQSTNYGLLHAGVSWSVTDATNASVTWDRYAVASADGYLYILNWESCIFGTTTDTAKCTVTNSNTSYASSETEKKARLSSLPPGVTVPPCVQKIVKIDGNPSISPVRFVPQSVWPQAPAGGVLLVSTTDANLNTNGTLYGFDATTGAQLWKYALTSGGAPIGVVGVAPAIDDTRDLMYLAYGGTVAALYSNGTLAAMVTSNATEIDPFVSSVSLSGDASFIYVHSASGSVWRFAVSGGVADKPLVLTPEWACEMSPASQSCSVPEFKLTYETVASVTEYMGGSEVLEMIDAARLIPVAVFDVATTASPSLPGLFVPVLDSITGLRVPGLKHARALGKGRDTFVGAGTFYQLTTLQERDLLHAALHQAVATHTNPFIAAKARGYDPESPLAQRVSDAAFHASMLTQRELDLLGALKMDSESDPVAPTVVRAFYRQDGRGLPRYGVHLASSASPSYAALRGAEKEPEIGPTFASTFPYSTITVRPTNDFIYVSQFIALGEGNTALYAFNPVSQQVVWTFQNFTMGAIVVPFGRSRSTPTVDATGGLYVGADVDLGDQQTIPVMFAFQKQTFAQIYNLHWITDMGQGEILEVGYAQPVIKGAQSTQNEVIMAASTGIYVFRESLTCPSSNDDVCSGNGECNCFTAKCTCEAGFSGYDCNNSPAVDNDSPGTPLLVGVTVGAFTFVLIGAILIWLHRTYGLKSIITCKRIRYSKGNTTLESDEDLTSGNAVPSYGTSKKQIKVVKPNEGSGLLG